MSKKMAQTFHSYDDSKYFWDISRSLLKESLFVFWSEVLSHKTDTVTFFVNFLWGQCLWPMETITHKA